jgi:drug/metabolite transporter (DMT)-like permease
MTIIWGTNYSIVKHAFQEIDAQAFNALRLILSSSVFLTIIVAARVALARRTAAGTASRDPDRGVGSIFITPAPITRTDWAGLLGLGVIGHCCYQYFFVGGLARTSVANSSLLLAATPVIIALLGAALGQERVGRLHWAGAALSIAGIYVVVGHGAGSQGSSGRGDLMMFTAVCCWAIYTMGARQLMLRHSPVGVTGISMAIGTLLYVPIVSPQLAHVAWRSVSVGTWIALVYSALFALCVSYTIWYAAVREIGSARTSVYSNLVPIVAMVTAVVALGEPVSAAKLAGATAVICGVALTRVAGSRALPAPHQ